MVKINRIYTRTGDDGTTGLVDGSRVSKDSLRVEAYGCVDELNSFIGLACAECGDKHRSIKEKLLIVQNELFDLGSLLAAPSDFDRSRLPTIEEKHIKRLESWIDVSTEGLAELRSFLLPGGTKLNGYLHVCRSVARRTERHMVALAKTEQLDKPLLIYMNRLSDFFFALARSESSLSGVAEILWVPGISRKTN